MRVLSAAFHEQHIRQQPKSTLHFCADKKIIRIGFPGG
jgi:hypothetical protein